MSLEQKTFETVIYVIGGRVFIAGNLVDDHGFLHLNLVFGKSSTRCHLHQQSGSLLDVLFQHCCVQDNLLFGRVGVQLPSESFEVTVYHCGALGLRPLEKRMLYEMCRTGMEFPRRLFPSAHILLSRSAAHAQCAACDTFTLTEHCIPQPVFSL